MARLLLYKMAGRRNEGRIVNLMKNGCDVINLYLAIVISLGYSYI